MEDLLKITRSKTGIPCLWEEGGGMSNTGFATIVAGPDGSPKRALYIRRKGDLACNEHALIPIEKGDVVVTCSHHRGDFTIRVARVVGFVVTPDPYKRGEFEAPSLETVAEFSEGQWSSEHGFGEAVIAAKGKAMAYHCRNPYFVKAE